MSQLKGVHAYRRCRRAAFVCDICKRRTRTIYVNLSRTYKKVRCFQTAARCQSFTKTCANCTLELDWLGHTERLFQIEREKQLLAQVLGTSGISDASVRQCLLRAFHVAVNSAGKSAVPLSFDFSASSTTR